MANGDADARVAWVGVEDEPVLLSNMFLVQFVEDEFVITFGMLTPPVVELPVAAKLQEVLGRQSQVIAIQTTARVGLTGKRLGELIDVLTNLKTQYDQRSQKK